MTENLKIVIPMAGWGSRLRPHTWSRPKPLISAGDTTVLGHLLGMLRSAEGFNEAELIFIVGHLGDQIEKYMDNYYPSFKTNFVKQDVLLGQSHAILMAKEFLSGPTLVVFVDTIVEADFSAINNLEADGLIWVKEVPDPRRFGVASLGKGNYVKKLVEKPNDVSNNLAVVGIYFFKEGKQLLEAIDKQIAQSLTNSGEYFLADAINILVKQGFQFRCEKVQTWLDTGLPDTVLDTNKHMLTNGHDNTDFAIQKWREGNEIKYPVFIHPSAKIKNSYIRGFVTIGEKCEVEDSIISDSVIEAGAKIYHSDLKHSLIGERGKVTFVRGEVNLGDDSSVTGDSEDREGARDETDQD